MRGGAGARQHRPGPRAGAGAQAGQGGRRGRTAGATREMDCNAGARNQGSALSDGGRRLRTAPQGLARTGGSGVTICT